MRAKSLLAFAMAIGCGLVAMIGVQQSLKKQSGSADADKVTVFVAATEIPPGQVLDTTMLEKQKFLKGSVPPDAVTDIAQLEKRALTVKVMKGDIIRLDKLGEEGKTGASISIPVGMRLVTVPANLTFAHSGMLKPEDRVDLMVTYRVQPDARTGRDYSETKTFLSYVEVFATDSVRDPNAGADPSGKASVMKNISLLVTPEQAQTVAMAKSIGELTLNLRNTSDKQVLEVNNLTPDQFRKQILQASMPPPDEHGKTPRPTVETAEDESLESFVTDAMGKPNSKPGQGIARAQATAKTEAWDIAIFGKTGMKIETVEVERRNEVAKPTRIQSTESPSKKVVNSLIDIFEAPQTEVVSLKPVHVGRPIYPELGLKTSKGKLESGLPKGLLTQPTSETATPVEPEKSGTNPVTPVDTKPAASKSAKTTTSAATKKVSHQ